MPTRSNVADSPNDGSVGFWLRPEEVEKIALARAEHFSHVTIQVRVDRHDDYYTVRYENALTSENERLRAESECRCELCFLRRTNGALTIENLRLGAENDSLRPSPKTACEASDG